MGVTENTMRASRVVVKVGTSTLTYGTGKLNLQRIETIVKEMADLCNQGKQVVLVSSGAIGAGVSRLGLAKRPETIPGKQAAAAVGQGILMHIYEKMFSEYGLVVAQVLLTRDDLGDRKRYLNARDTLDTLLAMGVIPIINENDTVAVDDIKFGDNDLLSALVAGLIGAEILIILSDIDGLYSADPQRNKDAKLIRRVEDITQEIIETAGGAGSKLGTGGMLTKIQAAKISVQSGVTMFIANGAENNVIHRILRGEEIGTVFIPGNNPLDSRKRWIAFGHGVQGKLFLDDGAVRAIKDEGKSLLASGIKGIEGDFERGSSVDVCGGNGVSFGRGLVNYSAREIQQIKGCPTASIEHILGYKYHDEVIHRDNLVLFTLGGEIHA